MKISIYCIEDINGLKYLSIVFFTLKGNDEINFPLKYKHIVPCDP